MIAKCLSEKSDTYKLFTTLTVNERIAVRSVQTTATAEDPNISSGVKTIRYATFVITYTMVMIGMDIIIALGKFLAKKLTFLHPVSLYCSSNFTCAVLGPKR